MKRVMLLTGPWLAIGSGTAAIVELGLGMPLPRPLQFLWPALMILWSLLVLANQGTIVHQRKTIEIQRKELDRHRERYAHDIRGWWN